jgi:hypothetical protein
MRQLCQLLRKAFRDYRDIRYQNLQFHYLTLKRVEKKFKKIKYKPRRKKIIYWPTNK